MNQKRNRVLIVSSDEALQLEFAHGLTAFGCEGVHAFDRRHAELSIQEGGVDGVICDLDLLGDDSLEFLQLAESSNQELPTVAVFAEDLGNPLLTSIRLPVIGVRSKPVDSETVASIIARHVAFCQSREMLESVRKLETEASVDLPTALWSAIELSHSEVARELRRSALEAVTKAARVAYCHSLAVVSEQYQKRIALGQALRDAVGVLAETKRAFKSRRLRVLREQIEEILANEPLLLKEFGDAVDTELRSESQREPNGARSYLEPAVRAGCP